MIDIRMCLEQVRRLRVTNYFSMLDEQGIGELARMLSFAETDVIAVAVINQWLEDQTERPTPADLRGLVAAQNEAYRESVLAEYVKPKTYECVKCNDQGYFGGEVSGTDAQPWQWCDCERAAIVLWDSPNLVDKANEVRERLLPAANRSLQIIPRIHQDVGKVYSDV